MDEMFQASHEEKQTLKAEHGKVYPVELDLGDRTVQFLVRAPTKPEYQLFMRASVDEEARAGALPKLSRPCVLWPSKQEADGIFNEFPGALDSLAAPLLKLAGMQKTEAGKAL